MHRNLLELIYYLPFGFDVEFHYYAFAYMLPKDFISYLPGRLAKPILKIRAEKEAKKAREKLSVRNDRKS